MPTKRHLTRSKIILLVAIATSIIAGGSVGLSKVAEQNKGAEEIELPGGTRGPVPFPHHRHQDKLGDCDICHSLYPQDAGGRKELKAQGKLKKKHVMNKQCTKCHKQKKKEGLKAGPTTCAKCHIKEKK
jgi:hypothetical protein